MTTQTPTSYNYQGFNVTPDWQKAIYQDGNGTSNTLFFNPNDKTQSFSTPGNSSGILGEIVNSNAYFQHGGNLNFVDPFTQKSADLSSYLDMQDNGGNHFAFSAKNQNAPQTAALNLDNFQVNNPAPAAQAVNNTKNNVTTPANDFTTAVQQNPFTTTLNVGSTGSDVSNLQKILNAQGANLTVDGQYGPKTAAAVKAYQAAHNLTADGIFGPLTSKALTTAINGAGAPGPGSTTPGGVVDPNASVNLTSGSSPTFDSSSLGGNMTTADVMGQRQSYEDTINGYLKQQSDAYAALNNTKAQALQGQANIMYGRNGTGGSDADLQGAEQSMFDRQMAFKTLPAQLALDTAQNALSLYKQSPAYLNETQARDTAYNLLQSYPDINYQYNPSMSAAQNLQAIKEALPSSAHYQASLVAYKGYTDPNGVFHMYNSKDIAGSPATPGAGATSITGKGIGPLAPAPSKANPVTPAGTYLGVGTTKITAPAPLVDKPTTKTQVNFVENWNTGTLGTAKNALNTAIGHLFEADQLYSVIGNGDNTVINSAKNSYNSTFKGNSAASNYETAATLASNELASAYGGDAASDRTKLAKFGGSNQSPSQHAGYLSTSTSLLASKLGAIAEQYRGAFGHYPASLDTLISPVNQAKLAGISGVDLSGLVNGLHVSPSTQALINSAKYVSGKVYLPDAQGLYHAQS